MTSKNRLIKIEKWIIFIFKNKIKFFKPKYVQNLIKAHERRELYKLVHDENVYKKERETEAGAFDDKEAFITEAYKKKIAERNEFRKKVEMEDALDG